MQLTQSIFGRPASIIILLVAVAASAAAQTPSQSTPATPQTPSKPSLEREFFKNILRDQRDIWTMPFHLRGRDAYWLAPLAVGTAALISTDRRTAEAIGDNASRISVSRQIGRVGIGYAAGGIAAGFYLMGRAADNERARETGILGGEAIINGIIVSQALKVITQRPRPIKQRGSEQVLTRGHFFSGGNAFPSGHAVTAWSLATVVAHEYRSNLPVQVAAYGLASLVSVSRFTGRRHYLSDVLVGSAIGFGIGRHVFRSHHDPALDTIHGKRTRINLAPHFTPACDGRAPEYGLSVALSF